MYIFYFDYCYYLYVCTCAHICVTVCTWRLEDNFVPLIPSFHLSMGSEDDLRSSYLNHKIASIFTYFVIWQAHGYLLLVKFDIDIIHVLFMLSLLWTLVISSRWLSKALLSCECFLIF